VHQKQEGDKGDVDNTQAPFSASCMERRPFAVEPHAQHFRRLSSSAPGALADHREFSGSEQAKDASLDGRGGQ
jgi:hypothetical protein